MTELQTVSIALYLLSAFFAVWGGWLTARRAHRKYRDTLDDALGDWDDPRIDPVHMRDEARSDAWWSFAEFGFIALGVLLGAVASIILVVFG